jgi:hypothetical protein
MIEADARGLAATLFGIRVSWMADIYFINPADPARHLEFLKLNSRVEERFYLILALEQ